MKIEVNDEAYDLEVKAFVHAYFPPVHTQALTDDKQLKVTVLADTVQLLYLVADKVYERSCEPLDWDALGYIAQRDRMKEKKRLLKRMIFDLMDDVHGQRMPWGILNGIRPTKVVFTYMDRFGEDLTGLEAHLWQTYRVSTEKAALMKAVALKEKPILARNKGDEMSVYIGIPYCPTKCLYCSFTSFPVVAGQDQMAYVRALSRELQLLGEPPLKGRRIRSLYFGGGTPTSLDAEVLEYLLRRVSEVINLENVEEFTVEAGRPDTITREKLEILKRYGVNRISINPQTMNDDTLVKIGRRHSAAQIREAYELAREIGFETINMDLIVGLPDEDGEAVARTMAAIRDMAPEHVTMHTMAIKKGSLMREQCGFDALEKAGHIEAMIRTVSESVDGMGLEPYYLYRQKNILGNFENVGYAKPGHECIYNVEIMEEKEDILAFGAGASSKIVSTTDKTIERIENVSDVKHYISRVEEMIERKRHILLRSTK